MTYDAARNGARSYDLALAAIREGRIRAGEIQPQTDQERAWAKEGSVQFSRYATAQQP